jgi:Exocyst complex component Sec3
MSTSRVPKKKAIFKSGTKDDRANVGKRNTKPEYAKASISKAHNIAMSAGTSRLNRILDQPNKYRVSYVADWQGLMPIEPEFNQRYKPKHKQAKEEIKNPDDESEVGVFVAKVVVPELRVDSRSIGGMTKVKKNMSQETLVSMKCHNFDLQADKDAISKTALEFPDQYAKHKRSLGFGGGTKIRHKVKYVLLVRSTNNPLHSRTSKTGKGEKKSKYSHDSDDDDDDDDVDDEASYDRMFRPEEQTNGEGESTPGENSEKKELEEVSSFPVLVLMSLNPDGTNPDVRKLVELDQLTTVQNVSTGGATVVHLVFADGDTVKIDFAVDEGGEVSNAPSASMRKERFVWSLLQIHAMLCTSVVERNSLGNRGQQGASSKDRLLQPLNVRNLDRAELQYVATVNGFLRDSPALCALLDRQRDIGAGSNAHIDTFEDEEKKDEMDGMAYDMMMGNFSARVALYSSAEERADAEEVLNAISFQQDLTEEGSAADALANKLQDRMRELEAETCMRLIAWEDEKHYSVVKQNPYERDSEDAMSLGNLFRTLDLLDKELGQMEVWLHDRAAVIKPLTDDCRDIEEENRQLEQQWKSYEMMSDELRRLLTGVSIPKASEKILKNPASALLYTADGSIDIEASEAGVDEIHIAGRALKSAMDNARRAGGVHLRAVNERVEQLVLMSESFCTALAQIIVTVMEQIKTDVMVASDNGKVSKSDTHATIAKKIRDVRVMHDACNVLFDIYL